MLKSLVVAAALALAAGAAIAADPAKFFTEKHWSAVRDFYNEQMRAGHCPIGFAKKEDGCVPPSHARKWAVRKPLPSGAIRFDLPPALAAKLGKPPASHRYVRVGPDILLVSNRTKLVTDAVLDLGRR